MADIALFPPVLGIRQGVLDAADILRRDGHHVLVADILDGRTFDDYAPAMAYAWEDLGQDELLRRGLASAADLPDGLVPVGFSLGCVQAVHVATSRPVSGVVMIAGAIPPSALGPDVRWPAGVPAQTHSTIDDPWRDQDEVDGLVRDVATVGGSLEVFDYPGSGHLFNDPSLPTEYDPVATETMWSRVLPFLRSLG